jgi:hypothetical protein
MTTLKKEFGRLCQSYDTYHSVLISLAVDSSKTLPVLYFSRYVFTNEVYLLRTEWI